MPVYEAREKFITSLNNIGYTEGSLEDRLLLFLADLGYSAGSIDDRFSDWLKDESSSTLSLPDLIYKRYIDLGFSSLSAALENDDFLLTIGAFFIGTGYPEANISITFSEEINPASVTNVGNGTGTFELKNDSKDTWIAGSISTSDNITFTFNPTPFLTVGDSYTVFLSDTIEGSATGLLYSGRDFSFNVVIDPLTYWSDNFTGTTIDSTIWDTYTVGSATASIDTVGDKLQVVSETSITDTLFVVGKRTIKPTQFNSTVSVSLSIGDQPSYTADHQAPGLFIEDGPTWAGDSVANRIFMAGVTRNNASGVGQADWQGLYLFYQDNLGVFKRWSLSSQTWQANNVLAVSGISSDIFEIEFECDAGNSQWRCNVYKTPDGGSRALDTQTPWVSYAATYGLSGPCMLVPLSDSTTGLFMSGKIIKAEYRQV